MKRALKNAETTINLFKKNLRILYQDTKKIKLQVFNHLLKKREINGF